MTVALNQSLQPSSIAIRELCPPWTSTRSASPVRGTRRSSWQHQRPDGLMRFWKLDYSAILAGSGTPGRSFGYLIGNQTIAEQMIRHEPEVVL